MSFWCVHRGRHLKSLATHWGLNNVDCILNLTNPIKSINIPQKFNIVLHIIPQMLNYYIICYFIILYYIVLFYIIYHPSATWNMFLWVWVSKMKTAESTATQNGRPATGSCSTWAGLWQHLASQHGKKGVRIHSGWRDWQIGTTVGCSDVISM